MRYTQQQGAIAAPATCVWYMELTLYIATLPIGSVSCSNERVDDRPTAATVEALSGAPRHCVLTAALETKQSTQAAANQLVSVDCFRSFDAALESATGHSRRLLTGAQAGAAAAGVIQAARSVASNVLSIEYVAPNCDSFWGSRVFVAPQAVGCGVNERYVVRNLNDRGFNDVISSSEVPYDEDCLVAEHYEHRDFSGRKAECYGGCCAMSNLNDRTSSIVWNGLLDSISIE
ncbi:MAG: hypothetical protein RL701_2026 [Pseudomonadota bacterium]